MRGMGGGRGDGSAGEEWDVGWMALSAGVGSIGWLTVALGRLGVVGGDQGLGDAWFGYCGAVDTLKLSRKILE